MDKLVNRVERNLDNKIWKVDSALIVIESVFEDKKQHPNCLETLKDFIDEQLEIKSQLNILEKGKNLTATYTLIFTEHISIIVDLKLRPYEHNDVITRVMKRKPEYYIDEITSCKLHVEMVKESDDEN